VSTGSFFGKGTLKNPVDILISLVNEFGGKGN